MTRDHFEALAEAIRDAKLPDDAGADAQRLGIADAASNSTGINLSGHANCDGLSYFLGRAGA